MSTHDTINVPLENDEVAHFDAFLLFVKLSIDDILFHDAYAERIRRFSTWCDRDKSANLESKEVELGILTILKLMITDEHHNPLTIWSRSSMKRLSFTAYDLLPVCELPTQKWKIEDFKCLLLDTLVEHIKYNCLLESFPVDEDGMKSRFNDINYQYLNPLRTTIETKMLIPKPNEWKLIPWWEVLKTIAFILAAIFVLPILTLIKFVYDSRSVVPYKMSEKICDCILIGFVVICSFIFYVDYACVVIYHYYSGDMYAWNVVFLEAYWPVVLHMYVILYFGLDRFHEFVSGAERDKQLLVEQCYEDARFDFYEKNVRPIKESIQTTQPNDAVTPCKSRILPIIGTIIYFAAAISRLIIPQLFRSYGSQIGFTINSTSLDYSEVPTPVQIIVVSYWVVGTGYTIFFFLMIYRAWSTYILLAMKVNNIMASVRNNDRFIETNSGVYYDLRKPINLD